MPPSDPSTPAAAAPPAAAARTRALDDSPQLAARAAAFLHTPRAMVQLDEADTRCIVAYMRLVSFPRGTVVLREGDGTTSHHMLLVLEGEVSVDVGELAPVSISVLGPGSLVGEMALLDGAARSASCTALSDVQAAGLSRRGMQRLIEEHPATAARLLAGLGQRMAERLRALNQHIQLVSQLNLALNEELQRAGRR